MIAFVSVVDTLTNRTGGTVFGGNQSKDEREHPSELHRSHSPE